LLEYKLSFQKPLEILSGQLNLIQEEKIDLLRQEKIMKKLMAQTAIALVLLAGFSIFTPIAVQMVWEAAFSYEGSRSLTHEN
jgi:hypothetical protein